MIHRETNWIFLNKLLQLSNIIGFKTMNIYNYILEINFRNY